ncbi:xyloglucan-specific galacturonosyltransferase 1-like [Canna indica]|uniref:Xyloglucan-specific galacturonosyltransferase 1-like n=1 Tax=Canna indica TaxID=4628 RepID=A0AAQ3KYB5_9LILI|nr:xyloglucan-specific galacturonosyltransferase 1-like [Canna indica]
MHQLCVHGSSNGRAKSHGIEAPVVLPEKIRCIQVPIMVILLLLVNIWCTFLFLHFDLCGASSRKFDLYCIFVGTSSHSKLAQYSTYPEELGTVSNNRTEQDLAGATKPLEGQERIHTQQPVEPAGESNGTDSENIKAVQRYMKILRSLASKTTDTAATPRGSCDGRGIFVYELPTKFNKDLMAQCSDLLPWSDLCKFFSNVGMGEPVPKLGKGWYRSHQYFLEPIFHSRISNHPCRVDDHNAAELFYVPFYGGLDILRWHFKNVSSDVKDALGAELVKWLAAQPSWTRNSGADHMFVLGKISWDFRRTDSRGAWGNNFLLLDEMRNPYKFLIERHPWELNEIGVPHPTHFHPHDDGDIISWQLRLRGSPRKHLASFAGAAREAAAGSIRSALIEQCVSSGGDCGFLDCSRGGCMRAEAVVELFMESEFCLQPPGDSPTRKSVFDSLVSGCIPVLFSPFTAYYQYPWHLPEDHRKYSVFIEEGDVKEGKVEVMERLRKISREEREEMRRFIVQQMLPGLVYGDSTARFDRFRDAFDIVVDNMVDKVKGTGR